MWIFYFLFWTVVRASEPLYRKIGDQAVLTPDSVENPIYNIRWKHGENIAMEWYGNETSYKQFKDRGLLNISTGVMTITGLTPDLSGIYTAEINGKETSKTQLLVISPVPKPSIYTSCDAEMTSCVFSCDGSITGAEPVTYWWTAGEKRWNSTKQLRITKEEEEQWFICILENPVSSNSSEKVFNPFMESKRTWIYILIAIIVVIPIVIIIIIIYFRRKYEKDLQSCHPGTKPIWQYEGKKRGGWCDYIKKTDPPNKCSVTNDDTERQHKENSHSNEALTVNGEPNVQDVNRADSQRRHRDPSQRQSWAKRSLLDFTKKIGHVKESSVSSDDIEKWYQEKRNVKMPLTLDGKPFELDFNKMIQTNLKTGKVRNIRRVLLRPESPPAMEETSTQITTSAAETSNETAAADLLSRHPGTKPIWQYEGKKRGEWCDYMKKTDPPNKCSVNNDDTERQHEENPYSNETLTVNGDPNVQDVNRADSQRRHRDPSQRQSERRSRSSRLTIKIGRVSVSSVSSDDIERWYQEKRNVKMPLTLDEKSFELDFNKMIQTNLATKTKRKIRVVLLRSGTAISEEMTPLLSPVKESSNQDLTSVVIHSNSSVAEKPPSLPAMEETSTQITTSAAETSNETGDTDGTEQEMAPLLPVVQESSNHVLTSVVIDGTSNEAVMISTVSEVNETSAQDLETTETPDPSNDTENPVSLPAVEETSIQNTTSAPETRNETATVTGSLEIPLLEFSKL